MSILLKNLKSIDDEIIRMLAGFSQMHLPSLLEEISKWHPPIDVMETNEKLIIIVEIAGLSASDISIKQLEEVITIQGKRGEIFAQTSPMFHHMEINYGPFERRISIPEKFIGGKASAVYRNGFLRIEIAPAKDAQPLERMIEIK